MGIEPAPRVVEAVRDLVADDRPDAAVVHGVVRLRVEERRLEDAGREHDLVEQRVVVRVDDVGGQLPPRPVDGLTQAAHRVVVLEQRRRHAVAHEGVPADLELRDVAPLRRVADLPAERGQLAERLFPRRLRHPCGIPDRPAHRGQQVPDHRLAARLRRGRERLLDVHPGDLLADVGAGGVDDAAPPRQLLLPAGERPTVELEPLVLERGRQRRRERPHEVPAQVVADRGEIRLGEGRLERHEERRVVDAHRGRRHAEGSHVTRQARTRA